MSGWPTRPKYPVTRGVADHLADGQGEAVDIAAPFWTPLYPVHRAYVTRKFYDSWEAGYAVDYAWNDQDGGHEVRYAHMIEEATVDIGTWVDETTLLGYVGSTGLSTGPHVHIVEIINGLRVDPEEHCLKEEEDMTDAQRQELTRIRDIFQGWADKLAARSSMADSWGYGIDDTFNKRLSDEMQGAVDGIDGVLS